MKQSRVIYRLARKLRSTQKRTKSWRKTAALCKVLGKAGIASPGLAFKIAKEKYEPSTMVFVRLAKDGAFGKRIDGAHLWTRLYKRIKDIETFMLEHRGELL